MLRLFAPIMTAVGLAACLAPKTPAQDETLITESFGTDTAAQGSKKWQHVTLERAVESRHPYFDNQTIIQNTSATACADGFQIHFKSFGVERGFDFVKLAGSDGSTLARYTGRSKGFWSRTLPNSLAQVRLESDESVTVSGYVIDQVRYIPWNYPICPMVLTKPCDPNQVDITLPRDPCNCPAIQRTCVDASTFLVTLTTARGAIQGHENSLTLDGAGQVFEYINIPHSIPPRLLGTIPATALAEFQRLLVQEHFFDNSYAQDDPFVSQTFAVTLGDWSNQKTIADHFLPGDNPFADALNDLLRCGAEDRIQCASGLSCQSDSTCR
jgi:hypothetical protein